MPRGRWWLSVALLAACHPSQPILFPEWGEEFQSFVRATRRGADLKVEVFAELPEPAPLTGRPGEMTLELMAYRAPLSALDLEPGPLPDAPNDGPRRSLPTPDQAWAFSPPSASLLAPGTVPPNLAEVRVPLGGCHEIQAEPLVLPEAVGHIRFLGLIEAGRLVVVTSRYPEEHGYLGSFRFFLIEGERVRRLQLPDPPTDLNAYYVGQWGCLWISNTSSVASCVGPGPQPDDAWREWDRIQLPEPWPEAHKIGAIDGLDRPEARDLYFSTDDGAVFRVTDRPQLIDGRGLFRRAYPHRVRRQGPGEVLALHGDVAAWYRGQQPPLEVVAPSDAFLSGLSATSRPIPGLGLVLTGDSGPRSKLLTLDLEARKLEVLPLPFGGDRYINNIAFDEVTEAGGTWLIPADNGYLIELVPFERDRDGQILAWDLCPPQQVGGGDFHQIVPDGDRIWTGGGQPDGPDDQPVRIYRAQLRGP